MDFGKAASLTSWRTAQGLRNAAEIDNDSFDAISFALDLGLQALHFVSIEGIGDILGYNQHSLRDLSG